MTQRCWIQAIGNGVMELSSVLWTGCIAYTLNRVIFYRDRMQTVERTLPKFLAIVFGVPLALTLLPLLQGLDVYGPAGGHATWCWIKPQYPHWVFICFYVPCWITMVFNALVHFRTVRQLKGVRTGGAASSTTTTSAAAGASSSATLDATTAARFTLIMQRLRFYPFILLIVWGPASVNRILEAATGGTASFFPLYFLQRVFSSSQGLLNALAYGFSRGIKEAVEKDVRQVRAWWAGRRGGGAMAATAAGAGGGPPEESAPRAPSDESGGGRVVGLLQSAPAGSAVVDTGSVLVTLPGASSAESGGSAGVTFAPTSGTPPATTATATTAAPPTNVVVRHIEEDDDDDDNIVIPQRVGART